MKMFLSAFHADTHAGMMHALRILNAKFQALECTPDFATGTSNAAMNDSDSDTSSVTSDSSATTDSSTFTNLTEEGDLTPLPLWNQIDFLIERVIDRVSWEEFIAVLNETSLVYDKEEVWTKFGSRTLKPCVETEEQHKYNKSMRCIICNTQLCESCAQRITDHIHGSTRANQEYAIAATRVSYPCGLDGCKDMVPLGVWPGVCKCLSYLNRRAQTNGAVDFYLCGGCIKQPLRLFREKFEAIINGHGKHCDCGLTLVADIKSSEDHYHICRLCHKFCEVFNRTDYLDSAHAREWTDITVPVPG
ncbi:hypothetical protein OCU04_009714 [Sclerotinia nivalis]|uniref:Uncharacterized protein n=1 Tax=Sclerotinia nivalis TaxID=352851 RepID=A0A9X0AFN2_9HELO|nr:hypothetical protein OCU04_009714 [Sclerotinia nivalis]